MDGRSQPVYHEYSSYLAQAFNGLDDIVKDAQEKLQGVDFDTFVGVGLSGALVVPYVARAMRKHWAIVRKDNDSSHAEARVEGSIGQRWIFLDDLIASGLTRRKVRQTLADLSKENWDYETRKWVYTSVGSQTEYVGDYLYYTRLFRPYDFILDADL